MSKSKRPATAPQPTRVDWAGTRTRRFEYLPSAVVFAQGDDATSVMFVERGVIRLSVVSHAGKEAVVALLDMGHFFGVARDQSEAAEMIERHITTEAPRSVYDALLLPALNYAERDRLEQRLSPDEETAVIDATRELLSDTAESIRRLEPEPSPPDEESRTGPRESLRVLGVAANGRADEVALEMLGHVLDDLPIVVEVTNGRMMSSELVSHVRAQGVSVICLADLPPSPPSKTRYLVKRLHAAVPNLRILVGRWGPEALADDSTQFLRDAGATLVASTLAETRTYLGGLVEIPRIPPPAAGSADAA